MIITAQFDGFILFIFMSPSFSNWGHIYLVSNLSVSPVPCADPGIFVRGGPAGQSDKKALTTFFFFFFFFLLFSLFYRSQMVNFIEVYHFQGSRGGPTFSRGGGGPTFSKGVKLLIPYRNPYNL